MYSIRSLYRIGRGPSASHTIGPARAATIFREHYPQAGTDRVQLQGSLAATGRGHMTDLAIEQALAPAVRVNAIGPGPTLRGARQSETHFARQRAATILNRGANPADVVRALDFFLQSPSVTGQIICTDGGQHLGWQTPDVLGVE